MYSTGVDAEVLAAVVLLVEGLGQVGVQPYAVLAGQLGRGPQQVRRSPRRASTGPARRAASSPGRGRGSGRSRRRTRPGPCRRPRRPESGGSPPWRRPRSIDPRVGWKRRPTVRAASTAAASRSPPPGEHVVVVGRGRAAGQGERGERARGRRPGGVLVEVRPDRVERGEPLEERPVDGEAARHPLVEVVVGVHEPGGDQAAAGVQRRPVHAGSAGPSPTAGDHAVDGRPRGRRDARAAPRRRCRRARARRPAVPIRALWRRRVTAR